MVSYTLKIADYPIQLNAMDDAQIVFEEGYDHFVERATEKSDYDLTINCYSDLPDNIIPKAAPLFSARQDQQLLWRIYSSHNKLLFVVYNQEKSDTIQQIAFFDEKIAKWEVYARHFTDSSTKLFCPLQYPMGPLIMYYLTTNQPSIMIHASGVFDGEKGRIFSGFSGVGKSTLAKIWKSNGATIINDDRLIIRKLNNQWKIFNTPMFYKDTYKSAPLQAIFLPFHSPENNIEKLSAVKAVSSLLPFCIQHNYKKEFMANHLDFITELCSELNVYKLGVVPNKSIINFIKTHEH